MSAKQIRRWQRLGERARRKRGVVLLIVISLLVLFVLLGVTYAVIASRYKDTAAASKRLEFYRDKPQSELDRVFYDLLREPSYQYAGGTRITDPATGFTYDSALASAAAGVSNASSLAGHSLLRDLYGMHASGFGNVVSFTENTVVYPQLMAAQQFVRFHFNNTTTLLGDGAATSDVPNAYTGCWIHFVSGPLAGESVRIRGYDPANINTGVLPALLVDATSFSGRNLYTLDIANNPEFATTLVNSRFLLSGKPYGGSGHGWQQGNFATTTPAPTAIWGLTYNDNPAPVGADSQDPIGQFGNLNQTDGWHRALDAGNAYGTGGFGSSLYNAMFPPTSDTPRVIRDKRRRVENLVALMPHFAKYENAARSMGGLNIYTQPYTPDPTPPFNVSVALRNLERDPGPYMHSVQEDPLAAVPSDGTSVPPTFVPLNPEQRGANEPYDAYDPQNLWLAAKIPVSYIADPSTPDINNPQLFNPNAFYVGPSFHQGPLINYWFNRMITKVYDTGGAEDTAQSGPLSGINSRALQVAAFFFPYGLNGVLDPSDGPLLWGGAPPNDWAIRLRYVESVTRRVMFRPSVAMNPNFSGSNPFSPVRGGMPSADTFNYLVNTPADTAYANMVISDVVNNFSSAGGVPRNAFDVDNDNDGIRDSVWIDPGLPIVTMPDGRRYKRLCAIMVQDLDNRLNINAVGNFGQVAPLPQGAPVVNVTTGVSPGDYAHDPNAGPGMLLRTTITSNVAAGASVPMQLTRGIGVGPADIDPSILFPGTTATLSRLLLARYSSTLEPNAGLNLFYAQPGLPGLDATNSAVNDYQALRKLVGPVTAMQAYAPYGFVGMVSAPGMAGYSLAGSSPFDIQGRGAIYVDKLGHPIFYNFGFNNGLFDLVNSTYESNPYGTSSLDSPFTLNELERLLRPNDLDIAGVNSHLFQILGLNQSPGSTGLPRIRNAFTTLSSHIPSVNFAAPLWLKRQWTQSTSFNIANGTRVYTWDYPCIAGAAPNGGQPSAYSFNVRRLQQVLSASSIAEIAKARLPAMGDPTRVPIQYTFKAQPPDDPNNLWFRQDLTTTNPTARYLGRPLLQPWQMVPNLPNAAGDPNVQAQIDSLAGWDPGLQYEAITYDDQLRRMLPWEILHGEKLNLNRYFEDDAPSYLGPMGAAYTTTPPAYANQNDVPDIRGYLRTDAASRRPHAANNFQLVNTTGVYLSQRQLLARHLYCLMSLMIDPSVADFMFKDEFDYRNTNYTQNTPQFAGLTQAQWAAREMLARKIAQWAVNAVDAMDPDGVMTAFEYDVNPWNGWSVDGILGTEDDVDRFNFPERRVVWGSEQPDMVITETLATHDRRVHDSPYYAMRTKTSGYDDDMDQLALPQGSLFVELRNPRNPEVRAGAGAPETADRSYGPQPLYEYNGGLDRTRLRVDAVASHPATGALTTPVWRLAISEHIPAGEERQDYLPERNLIVTAAGTPIRQSFAFEPSYDFQSTVDQGNNAPNTVLREYVSTSPFVGNMDMDTGEERLASTLVLDGRSGGGNLYKNRTPIGGYMNGYTQSNTQRYRCRCELERFVYFTNGSPNLFTKHFVYGNNGDNSRTFSARNASGNTNIYLAPQQFMVVGPRQTTNFGAIQAKSLNPDNPYGTPDNIFDTGKGDLGWSLHRISLNPPGFTPRGNTNGNPVANYDANGVLMTPTVMNMPPVAVIAQRYQQLDATDNTTVLNYDNGHQNASYRGYVGLSVTEPLHLSDDQGTATSPTYYRRNIDAMATGPAGFYGAVAPPDQAEEPYVPDMPLDLQPYAPLRALEDKLMLHSGTYENRRIVFLQRLADPRVPWHRDANPYITIDWQTTDVTVFSGLDNTRKTTTGAQATAPNQMDMDPMTMAMNPRGVDAWNNPDNMQAENIDDPYSSTTDPDPKVGRMRSQVMTRERGFRNYPDQFERPNYPNFWNPVTSATWWDANNGYTAPTEAPNRYLYGMFNAPTLNGLNPIDWRRLPDFVSKQEQISEDQQILEFQPFQVPTLSGGPINGNLLLNTLGYENYSLGQRQTDGNIVYEDNTPPWNGIHDRQLASAMELLTVPASPSSRLGADFILPLLNDNGTGAAQQSTYSANIRIGGQPWGANGFFPSLLNMQWSSADTEDDVNYQGNGLITYTPQYGATGPNLTATGSALKRSDFVRIFDLVDIPSRFNGTEDFFSEELPTSYTAGGFQAFNSNAVASQPSPTSGSTFYNNGSANGWNGWESYRFPYNRASKMREPGKINLNTLYDRNVYQALVGDNSAAWLPKTSTTDPTPIDGFTRFLFARRGIPIALGNNDNDANSYGSTIAPAADQAITGVPANIRAMLPNVAYPSLINNPFRPASAADLMPVPVYADRTAAAGSLRHNMTMRNQSPVDATILRRDIALGPADEQPLFSFSAQTVVRPTPVDHLEHPYFRFQDQEQLANKVSGTSNVFAIWVTIGYFEVEPNYVNRETPGQNGLGASTGLPLGFVTPAQIVQAAGTGGVSQYLANNSNYIHIEYDVNHPDGTRLGAELGSDDATFARHRAFYIVDRSIPVAFEPGKTHNTERCVLLKRFIE